MSRCIIFLKLKGKLESDYEPNFQSLSFDKQADIRKITNEVNEEMKYSFINKIIELNGNVLYESRGLNHYQMKIVMPKISIQELEKLESVTIEKIEDVNLVNDRSKQNLQLI